MFSLLSKQQRQQQHGSVEHKQHDDDSPQPTSNKPIKRKLRTASSTDTSHPPHPSSSVGPSPPPLPSASAYLAAHPQRVARINFHRLLTRLEKQSQAAHSVAGEHKEALDSVRQQTLLRKVSQTRPVARADRQQMDTARPAGNVALTPILFSPPLPRAFPPVLSVAFESSLAARIHPRQPGQGHADRLRASSDAAVDGRAHAHAAATAQHANSAAAIALHQRRHKHHSSQPATAAQTLLLLSPPVERSPTPPSLPPPPPPIRWPTPPTSPLGTLVLPAPPLRSCAPSCSTTPRPAPPRPLRTLTI